MKVLIRILIILLLGSNICFAQYQPKFTNIIDVTIDYNNYSISNENADEWAGVSSFNFLAENTDGSIETTITNGDGETAFGFSKKDVGIKFHQIDYCFFINQNQLFIYEKGNLIAELGESIGEFTGGNLKIVRNDGAINYYINDELIYTSETESSELLVLDISIYNSSSLEDINCSFDIPFKSDISITNIDDENESGSITFSTNGDYGPFEYAFNNERYYNNTELQNYIDSTNVFDSIALDANFITQLQGLKFQNSYNNLLALPYPFSVYDNNNDVIQVLAIVQKEYEWAFTPEVVLKDDSKNFGYWDNNVWIKNGNSPTFKTDDNSPNFIHALDTFSIDTLLELSFTVNDVSDEYTIGFMDAQTSWTSDADFDYAIKLNYDKGYEIVLINEGVESSLTPINSGDIVKLQSRATGSSGYQHLKVFVNGELIAESAISKSIRDINYIIAGSFTRGEIGVVRIQEPALPRISISGNVQHFDCDLPATPGITLAPLNVYNFNCSGYTWEGPNNFTSTGCSISCSLPGEYTVSYLVNNIFNSYFVRRTFYVGYKVTWTDMVSTNAANSDPNRTIFSNLVANGWNAGAASVNTLDEYSNGWVEFEFQHTGNNYGQALGYSYSNTNASINTIKSGVHIFKSIVKPPGGSFINFVESNYPVYSYLNVNLTLNNYNIAKLENGVLSNPSHTVSNNTTIHLSANNNTVSVKSLSPGFNIYANLFTVPVNAANQKIIDISLLNSYSKIVKPRVSFGCPEAKNYAVLRKKLDGGFHRTQKKKLYFKFDEEYNDTDGNLTYKIVNKLNQEVLSNTSNNLIVNYGDNRYEINFNNSSILGTMSFNEYYMLEVTNEKKEKWFLRFYLSQVL